MKNYQTNQIALHIFKYATLSTALLTNIAQASPASIPAEFIGRWESKVADCRLPEAKRDFTNHVYIGKSGYTGVEVGCRVVSTVGYESGVYTAKMICSDEEGDSPPNITSFLLQKNNQLVVTQKSVYGVNTNKYSKCSK